MNHTLSIANQKVNQIVIFTLCKYKFDWLKKNELFYFFFLVI